MIDGYCCIDSKEHLEYRIKGLLLFLHIHQSIFSIFVTLLIEPVLIDAEFLLARLFLLHAILLSHFLFQFQINLFKLVKESHAFDELNHVFSLFLRFANLKFHEVRCEYQHLSFRLDLQLYLKAIALVERQVIQLKYSHLNFTAQVLPISEHICLFHLFLLILILF